MNKPLQIAFFTPDCLGYNRITRNLLSGLSDLGVKFDMPDNCSLDLVILPPDSCNTERARIGSNTVIFTMHETTRLHPDWLATFSLAKAIVVPSHWCASCFSAQGLNVPLYVCPLGFDPNVFYFGQNYDFRGPPERFIFSTVFEAGTGAVRKNNDLLLQVFHELKNRMPDADLYIRSKRPSKMVPEDQVIWIDDKLSEADYANFVRASKCGVFPSHGEGFGLCPLEYIACGIPIIVPFFGGLTEHVPYGLVNVIEGDLVPAKFDHRDNGIWFEPNYDSLCQQMLNVYTDYSAAEDRAYSAEMVVKKFTWKNCANRFFEILKKTDTI